jgi:signal transduction histidine kinase
MSKAWPLEAVGDDDSPLPPPWGTDVDVSVPHTESQLLNLMHRQPALVVRVCRRAFHNAQARGDTYAALHALYLACSTLYASSERPSADRVFAEVRKRAQGLHVSQLSTRIELTHARVLNEQGEHAQAMLIRQRALDCALALGDTRLTLVALGTLTTSAIQAGDAELALSLCEQQAPFLTDDGPFTAAQANHRANNMALAWMMIARARRAAGAQAAAVDALEQARDLALSACDGAENDGAAVSCLETLVQVLLLMDEPAEARAHFDRCTARLSAMPSVGGETWCVLELASARIDVQAGSGGTRTLQRLLELEASTVPGNADVHALVGDMRQVLLQAEEQVGDFEQALASHKRSTAWHAQRRSAQSRQRLKMLRHTVLAMRAEAVEFITHDLLTPLAAAQTWAQALLRERLSAAVEPPLRRAHALLADASALSGIYLGSLRAELMPRTQLQRLDFGALVDDVRENMRPAATPATRLARTIDIGTPVVGDATLLMKALTALLCDAFARAPAGTWVELSLAHDSTKGEAVLAIGHEGAGPPAAARIWIHQHAFEHRSFGAGHSALVLAAKVCRLHRMRLRFETAPGRGIQTRLTIKTAPDTSYANASELLDSAP